MRLTRDPWTVVQERHKEAGIIIGITDGKSNRWIARMALNPEISLEEELGNARLIAAAPEMLEVLEEIADEISANLIFSGKSVGEKALIEMLKKQRAIIKKAKGE